LKEAALEESIPENEGQTSLGNGRRLDLQRDKISCAAIEQRSYNNCKNRKQLGSAMTLHPLRHVPQKSHRCNPQTDQLQS
jgi:hypothetical protein